MTTETLTYPTVDRLPLAAEGSVVPFVSSHDSIDASRLSAEGTQASDQEQKLDAFNYLMKPEAQRDGTEVHDGYTGAARKPCFNVEVDESSRLEVQSVISRRSAGLEEVNKVLSSLPIAEGKVTLDPIPTVASLDIFIDMALQTYERWEQETAAVNHDNQAAKDELVQSKKQAAAAAGVEYQYDPWDDWDVGNAVAIPRPDLTLAPALMDTKRLSDADDRDKDPAERIANATKVLLEEHMRVSEAVLANQKLVMDGAWPGEPALQGIRQKMKFTKQGETEARAFISQQLVNEIPVENSGVAKNYETFDAAYTAMVRDLITAPYTNNLLIEAGLIPAKESHADGATELDGSMGTLADLYVGPQDVLNCTALADSLDTIFSKTRAAGDLRAEGLAARVVDFCKWLTPGTIPLVHNTSFENLGGILETGKLLPRGQAVGAQTITGSHSNYVHFAEPGKYAARYGTSLKGRGILVAVPLSEVVANSPYYQAEAMYRKSSSVDSQERVAEITIAETDLPLALEQRLKALEDRISTGLHMEDTQGDANNLSFAASDNPLEAGKYSYNLDTTTIVCPAENYDGLMGLLKTAGKNEQWINEHIVIAPTVGRLENPFDGIRLGPTSLFKNADPDSKIKLYGKITQRPVNFRESHIESHVRRARDSGT